METKPEKAPKPKPKTYKTISGKTEFIPGLGLKNGLTTELLQKPFVIQMLENYERRTGKRIFGTVVELS